MAWHPRHSIYTPPPTRRHHRCALDWWVHCLEWIPAARNASIIGRRVRGARGAVWPF
jgi:hypothetical protein